MCGELQVQGVGKSLAQPDRASISLQVLTEGKQAATAVKKNSETINEVVKLVAEKGVESRHIRTSGFSVQPRYKNGLTTVKTDGWKVSNSVNITIIDVDKLGVILTAASEKAAVQNLRFFHSKINELTDGAREAAVQDAKRRAEVYCKASGATLDGVIEIKEVNDHSYYGNRSLGAPGSVAGAGVAMPDEDFWLPVPIEQGEAEIQVTIQVKFQIKGGSCKCKDEATK